MIVPKDPYVLQAAARVTSLLISMLESRGVFKNEKGKCTDCPREIKELVIDLLYSGARDEILNFNHHLFSKHGLGDPILVDWDILNRPEYKDYYVLPLTALMDQLAIGYLDYLKRKEKKIGKKLRRVQR